MYFERTRNAPQTAAEQSDFTQQHLIRNEAVRCTTFRRLVLVHQICHYDLKPYRNDPLTSVDQPHFRNEDTKTNGRVCHPVDVCSSEYEIFDLKGFDRDEKTIVRKRENDTHSTRKRKHRKTLPVLTLGQKRYRQLFSYIEKRYDFHSTGTVGLDGHFVGWRVHFCGKVCSRDGPLGSNEGEHILRRILPPSFYHPDKVEEENLSN